MKDAPRRLAVIAAVALAIAAPAAQRYFDWGLTPAQFADQGDGTLRAAGYAFSIWGLIYLGLALYALWQALPQNRTNPLTKALAWPSTFACAGCAAWIAAAALDARWISVGIIAASAAVLTYGLMRAPRGKGGVADWLLVGWPLGLLAGWLTVATAINLLTVLTAEDLIERRLQPIAAAAGLIAVAVVAYFVLRRVRLLPYGAAVVWGLVAVWAAERGDQSVIGWLAMACAVLVGLAAAWFVGATAARR